MCDTVFALGQRGGYLFKSSSKWSYGGLPDKLARLFIAKRVASVHCVVLGAAESFFIAYRDKDGLDRCRGDGLPDGLQAFLFEKDSEGYIARDLSKLRVSLGPYNESYWAYDGSKSQWNNLPAGLLEALEARRKPGGGWTASPRIVALGANDNFVLITDKNGYSWNLSSYQDLRQIAGSLCERKADGASMIQTIYLNPYRLQCGVLQVKNGSAFSWNLPPHSDTDEAFKTIAKAIEDETLAIARQRLQELELERAMEARLRSQQAELLLAEQMASLRMLEAHTANKMAMNTAFKINMMNIMSNFYSNIGDL